MARIAALFPGQGSQKVGMGHDLADRWPTAASVFAEIDSGLGAGLSELCWNGPEEELRLTTNTQPALLAHSVAAWQVLAESGFRAEAVAGHSLGEYSAVVAAGGLGAVDAARTVRERGRLMQQAVPVGEGAMAAVLGLDDEVVVGICDEISAALGEAVVAANFNSPGQVVIAGTAGAVDRAIEVYHEQSEHWQALMANAMQARDRKGHDFSWTTAADRYLTELYAFGERSGTGRQSTCDKKDGSGQAG